jgi:hypothetical protein
MINWLKIWFIKRHQTQFSSLMFRIRGSYFYVDYYGHLWRLEPTGQHDNPFIICLEKK